MNGAIRSRLRQIFNKMLTDIELMPLFAKRNKTYIGALQCGAGRDAYLEFELAESNDSELELYAKDPMQYSLSEGVDPLEIKKAALLGAQMFNEKYGTNFKFKNIGLFPMTQGIMICMLALPILFFSAYLKAEIL